MSQARLQTKAVSELIMYLQQNEAGCTFEITSNEIAVFDSKGKFVERIIPNTYLNY